MEATWTVVARPRPNIAGGSIIATVGAVFFLVATSNSSPVGTAVDMILTAVCALLAYRGYRCGQISAVKDEIVVRDFPRVRHMPSSEVRGVRAEEGRVGLATKRYLVVDKANGSVVRVRSFSSALPRHGEPTGVDDAVVDLIRHLANY